MNNLASTLAVGAVLGGCMLSPAQQQTKQVRTERSSFFIQPLALHLADWLPAPPSDDAAGFRELHHIEATRTPAQIRAAQIDDAEEDIFSYRTVLGSSFRAEDLPLTATLSAHVHNEESVLSDPLKKLYHRPRPYQVDKTLRPVCKTTTQPNAYPSGHSLSGYLLAFTLIQIVPERSGAILERADDYAHNRLVCGVHTASDTEASRRVAYAAFATMLLDSRFQNELAAARQETRTHLHLGPLDQK